MPPRRKDKSGKEILTPREQRFIEGLARGKSATQAAKDAGYSEKTAFAIGRENLQKPAIREAFQERISAVKADTNEILSLFAMHVRGDFGDFDADCWNADGTVNWPELKKRGLSRLVRKVKSETRFVPTGDGEPEKVVKVELELYDAQAAARTLADIAGLKQQPRENDRDKADRRAYYERLVARLMERSQTEAGESLSRERAIEMIIQRDEAAARYLM